MPIDNVDNTEAYFVSNAMKTNKKTFHGKKKKTNVITVAHLWLHNVIKIELLENKERPVCVCSTSVCLL